MQTHEIAYTEKNNEKNSLYQVCIAKYDFECTQQYPKGSLV